MFMDTPEFLSTCLHTITVIAAPLHILGTYCILCRTPKTMTSVKWVMLNFHCWCMLLDWSLTILTVPFLLYPGMAGYPLGVLSEFGVGVQYQVFLIETIIASVHSSIVLVFENRYYIMFAKDTKWKYLRKIFTAGNYLFGFIIFVPALFNVPDQTIAVKHIHEIIPNLSPTIKDDKIFVLALEFTYVVVPVCMAIIAYAIQWYTLLTVLSRNMKNSIRLATHSKNTLALQKKFLHSMFIQAAVFLLSIQVPVIYGVISQFTGYYNQAFNNLSFIFLSIHGVSSTSVMIYLHKPYREYCAQVIGMAKKKLPQRSVVSVVLISQ